ncbi:glycosyltransferase involved in cell wall biosynthesis [Catenuloplanes nepalensis]|uniref:Glycosyltransferase involved in cell wall biosynthesis n=1 Tax=Catenuloplanes nepalensis TaxID=587533 RepID=A0ABT9MTM7_9ACTN|nr:glycosyltransferase [Catenuloplanes nepalensis]MDP9794797.1 glycosyltransferase involved in cell wall biosynthesis [Catenuloplanes nepalensis]
MRILIGADTYAPHVNGASYFAQRLAAALNERHEVHVVSPATGYSSSRRVDGAGIVEHRVRSLPIWQRREFRFSLPVALRRVAGRILDEVRPDVVHVQSHFPICRALVAAAHERGIFVVATNHFMPENLTHYLPFGREQVHAWGWRDAARVFARADVVTAPTPYAAALATVAGIPGPVLPISCGIDLSRFRSGGDAAGFRLRYGLADVPTVAFVGRLDSEKNLDVLVRAFATVRRRVRSQLLLVGTGAEDRALRTLAAELGIADSVRFAGFVPDEELPSAYAASTVFVNPGTAELQSLVTLEAMACGRPVLGADAAALPHLVINDETGFLFAPGDARALAGHLVTLLEDPDLAAAMGRRARAVAEQHDEERTVAAFEQLYAIGGDRAARAPMALAA